MGEEKRQFGSQAPQLTRLTKKKEGKAKIGGRGRAKRRRANQPGGRPSEGRGEEIKESSKKRMRGRHKDTWVKGHLERKKATAKVRTVHLPTTRVGLA